MNFKTYLDTALLVKSYVLEIDSETAVSIIEDAGDPLAFTHFHEIEILNAIRLKRFRGEMGVAGERAAIRALKADLKAGRLSRPVYHLPEVFARAEDLSARWSASLGTRSLDLLHIATALEIRCDIFASFDTRQRKCAAKAGLQVIPRRAANPK